MNHFARLCVQTLSAALLSGLLIHGASAHAEDTADSVLTCMRANVPAAVRVEDIEMDATDKAGNVRAMKGRLLVGSDKGLTRARLRMSAPADLAGAGYLLREAEAGGEDQMWVYLPTVGRVRRITGSGADGSLLGTDFSYGDVKEISNAFSGTDVKLEAGGDVDGRNVWLLTMAPKAGRASRYNRIRAWVDKQTCVALKVDFDANDQLAKELKATAAGLKQAGKYWYASDVEAHDLQNGTQTKLRVVGLTPAQSIPSGTFDPHSFFMDN